MNVKNFLRIVILLSIVFLGGFALSDYKGTKVPINKIASQNFQDIPEMKDILDPNNQETCFKQMGSGFADWNTDKTSAKKECSKIPDPNFLNWCISGV